MLFTHRGLSGPVILQASSYWNWKGSASVAVDLAPGQDWTAPLRNGAGRRDGVAARGALRKILPQRLADRWVDRHPQEDWTNRSLELMEKRFTDGRFAPSEQKDMKKPRLPLEE